MKCILHALCAAAVLLGGFAAAQDRINFDNARDGEQNVSYKFWVGIIGNPSNCTTAIRLDMITSVSKHCYTVDGVAFKEVTIDTRGNNSIRFYACLNERVNTNKERMSNTRALLDQKTNGAASTPAKKFPEGAYSHNVEYLVDSPADLDKLYESVINALIKNRGCTFKTK